MFRPRFATLLVCALLGAAPAARAAGPVMRNMDLLAHFDEYTLGPTEDSYSACWSYVHPDGREYAVLGVHSGTAIYDISNPAATVRVGFIPGPESIWREIKSYRNWIYVVTEGLGAGQGLQIIRMTDPAHPVLAATWAGSFVRSHTIAVDTTRALLVCNGTRDVNGLAAGMRILSLANPESPLELGHWPPGAGPVSATDYVHDSVPVGDRLYASSIYSGFERIFDFTVPGSPQQLTAWTWPGAFTHNAWPDASGKVLYATDEINGRPLRVFDIQDLGFPTLTNGLTSNPQAIVHNAHVKGDELYLSNYTEGVRVLDLSDPLHPAEFAWSDSWPGSSGGYFGVWEVCPYFPSGVVIASDMQTGLYVYRPRRDYGTLRVHVQPTNTLGRTATPLHLGHCGANCTCAPDRCTCASGGTCGCEWVEAASLAGFTATLDAVGDSLSTPDDGVVVFAADPGAHTLTVRRFGYFDETVAFQAAIGRRDTVVVAMRARPVGNFAGVVTDAGTQEPLPDAEVIVEQTALHVHTDSLGFYQLLQVPDDLYRVTYRAPGHAPLSYVRRIGPGYDGLSVALDPAPLWEPMEQDPGFTAGAPGDDATSGQWVRVEPLGTGLESGALAGARGVMQRALEARDRTTSPLHDGHETDGVLPGSVQPETDRTPGDGVRCWVTGQGTTPGNVDEADVDGGRTSLTTRPFDLTGYADPVIGYWRWFYSSTPTDVNDWLRISVSADGGATWLPAETVTGDHAHWEEGAVRVKDFVAPTADVRLRFTAADLGTASIVEAAIDDLVLYEAVHPTGAPPRSGDLALRGPWPNPMRAQARLAFSLAEAGTADLAVLDVQGRTLRVLARGAHDAGTHEAVWDGRDDGGRLAGAGLYFVRLRTAAGERVTRLARVP